MTRGCEKAWELSRNAVYLNTDSHVKLGSLSSYVYVQEARIVETTQPKAVGYPLSPLAMNPTTRRKKERNKKNI